MITAITPALTVAGFALIGLGVAVVVPLVFTAAGHGGRTPGEVAGVATITYLSGLTAPAVTGWVAGGVSYPAAFVMITVVLAGMTLLAPVLRQGARRPAETR